MNLFHIKGLPDGETVIRRVELPVQSTSVGKVQGLTGVPVTSLGLGIFVDEPKPDSGLHPAPRRQFLVVLRGEIELESSGGDVHRLHPGDVIFADDTEARGHHTRDVGAVPSGMMAVPVEEGWVSPDL